MHCLCGFFEYDLKDYRDRYNTRGMITLGNYQLHVLKLPVVRKTKLTDHYTMLCNPNGGLRSLTLIMPSLERL